MILLDTGRPGDVWAVAFHADGKHVLGGNDTSIRRWRLADGQEVAKQTGMNLNSICVSRDDKWIVCGTSEGAGVWDGELRKEIIHVEGENVVYAVDVSPDSTRFATGNHTNEANIWSITTGRRLVGSLELDDLVTGVRFSPSGEHVAAACYSAIKIFDSHTGDILVKIDADQPQRGATTPIAWSGDGQQIIAASRGGKIRMFDASTGTQRAESQSLYNGIPSIALATNGKFIAILAPARSVSFLDTSTLARVGPVIEGDERIWSVAISLDNTRLATGRYDGQIIIRDLREILPELFGPVNVSILPCPVSSPTLTTYLLTNRLNKTRSL